VKGVPGAKSAMNQCCVLIGRQSARAVQQRNVNASNGTQRTQRAHRTHRDDDDNNSTQTRTRQGVEIPPRENGRVEQFLGDS